jgi:hypothetical protein
MKLQTAVSYQHLKSRGVEIGELAEVVVAAVADVAVEELQQLQLRPLMN